MVFNVFENSQPSRVSIHCVFGGAGEQSIVCIVFEKGSVEQSMVFIVFENAQPSKVWCSLCFLKAQHMKALYLLCLGRLSLAKYGIYNVSEGSATKKGS